jgi:hypothetical protein
MSKWVNRCKMYYEEMVKDTDALDECCAKHQKVLIAVLAVIVCPKCGHNNDKELEFSQSTSISFNCSGPNCVEILVLNIEGFVESDAEEEYDYEDEDLSESY